MSAPILICFDGSEEATDAIHAAAALLAQRVALVLSVGVPAKDHTPLDPLSDVVGSLTKLYSDWDSYVRQRADEQARQGARIAVDAGLDARPLVAMGRPAETIVAAAHEHSAAAIVLGARRHSTLGGFLGSVSARVVARAGIPVLVIPPP